MIRLRAEADTSDAGRLARTETDIDGAPTNANTTTNSTTRRGICTSHESRRRHETVQSRLEAILAKRLGDPCVVDGSVGVDPVALWIHSKSEDFGKVRTFEQNLLTRNEARQQIEFHFVQLKQLGVVPAIERWVGQKELGRATLDMVRNKSAEAKSSTVCVARIIAALRLRQVFKPSWT